MSLQQFVDNRLPGSTLLVVALFCGASARCGDDLTGLSDEFDDATSLSDWTRHHAVAGLPDQAAVIDIDGTSAGQLYVEPEVTSWFRDYRGIFLFKVVTCVRIGVGIVFNFGSHP